MREEEIREEKERGREFVLCPGKKKEKSASMFGYVFLSYASG